MQAPARASEEYETQKALTARTLDATRSTWARMGDDWSRSWRDVGPRLALIVTAGQLGSARNGAAYVPDVLAEQGQDVRAVARVNERALAGRAADGRPLASLLSLALLRSRVGGSLEAGGAWLDMVVETELEDAHRGGVGLATIARPRTGYVRMVNTPCCKDCAVLAGRFYGANEGFLRHPNCRCFHLPTTDPESRYAAYPEPHEITGLTKGERKALEAGGDYSQVLNAARGRDRTRGVRVDAVSKMTTTEGTTKRGLAGKRLGGRQRLTPDGIYRVASDENEARRLLEANGYLL